jgi:hypothetical protein
MTYSDLKTIRNPTIENLIEYYRAQQLFFGRDHPENHKKFGITVENLKFLQKNRVKLSASVIEYGKLGALNLIDSKTGVKVGTWWIPSSRIKLYGYSGQKDTMHTDLNNFQLLEILRQSSRIGIDLIQKTR